MSTVPKPTSQGPQAKEEDGYRWTDLIEWSNHASAITELHQHIIDVVVKFIKLLGRQTENRSITSHAALASNECNGTEDTIKNDTFDLA